MKVTLRRTWFYPVDAKPLNDKRAISGGRYRKGTHDMPEELRPYLPKDAIVLDDKPTVVAKEAEITRGSPSVMADLGIIDIERVSADAEADLLAEAEATRKAAIQAKRVAALAKAREAKKAKKEAK